MAASFIQFNVFWVIDLSAGLELVHKDRIKQTNILIVSFGIFPHIYFSTDQKVPKVSAVYYFLYEVMVKTCESWIPPSPNLDKAEPLTWRV